MIEGTPKMPAPITMPTMIAIASAVDRTGRGAAASSDRDGDALLNSALFRCTRKRDRRTGGGEV
jgi:hypothetical protein